MFRKKLTDITIKRLSDAIGKGATQKIACGLAKISEVTFCSWHNDYKLIHKALENGQELEDTIELQIGDKQFIVDDCLKLFKLFKLIEEKESEYFQTKIDTINTASTTDWNAAKWVLERRARKDFGPSNTVNVGNTDGKPFQQIVQTKNIAEQLAEFEKELDGAVLGDPKLENE